MAIETPEAEALLADVEPAWRPASWHFSIGRNRVFSRRRVRAAPADIARGLADRRFRLALSTRSRAWLSPRRVQPHRARDPRHERRPSESRSTPQRLFTQSAPMSVAPMTGSSTRQSTRPEKSSGRTGVEYTANGATSRSSFTASSPVGGSPRVPAQESGVLELAAIGRRDRGRRRCPVRAEAARIEEEVEEVGRVGPVEEPGREQDVVRRSGLQRLAEGIVELLDLHRDPERCQVRVDDPRRRRAVRVRAGVEDDCSAEAAQERSRARHVRRERIDGRAIRARQSRVGGRNRSACRRARRRERGGRSRSSRRGEGARP